MINHGGSRLGSGRKPLPENKKKVPYNVRIRREFREWLQRQKNGSKEIDKALEKHIKRVENENCKRNDNDNYIEPKN